MKPELIKSQETKIQKLFEKYPNGSIPIEPVAKALEIDPDCLRESIAQGTCPFGVGGKHPGGGNRFGKVVTLPFYNWMMKGGS